MAAEEPCASPTLAPEEPPASTTLATEEPPAITTLATEEPPASPEQELSECATNTSSSAYSCGASSSSVGSGSPVFEGSLFGDTPSAQVSWGEEEEEEEDLSPITVIEQHLQGRAEVQKSPSCAATQSVLLLVPSPPRQGGLSQRIPHPQWGGHISSVIWHPKVETFVPHRPRFPLPADTIPVTTPCLCRATLVPGRGRLSLSNPMEVLSPGAGLGWAGRSLCNRLSLPPPHS
ncbi:protein SON-like isoform X1 [Mauremys reevesii]|uniref:protein SON-like isoform X1 n=1 Tax=Mauremys reevesii TaxID=260615 RepID=UPI00193F4D4E|nr:protein SON-like isoform X1 [Mauremys reevesii]